MLHEIAERNATLLPGRFAQGLVATHTFLYNVRVEGREDEDRGAVLQRFYVELVRPSRQYRKSFLSTAVKLFSDKAVPRTVRVGGYEEMRMEETMVCV